MEGILASAKFRLHGITLDGDPYDVTVVATLEKSGAFSYGNGTLTVFRYSDDMLPKSIDTRYATNLSPKTFVQFAKKVLEDWCAPTIMVDVVRGESGE